MLTIWSKERATDLLYKVGMPQVEVCSGDTPPNPKGQVLLCLGKKPLEYFTVLGLVPKNRTITSLRGNVYKANLWGQEVSVMFSYSVGIGAIDAGKFLDLQTDLNMALRLERTGTLQPVLGDYRYVSDFKEAVAELKQREADGEKRIDIALDLETLGLDPYKVETIDKGKKVPRAYIITVQFTYREGMADVVYFENKEHADEWIKENRADMEWILNHSNLVMNGANLKYDLHWIYRHFDLECTNFKFDTTLVGSLLDENRSNALDVHAKIYCPELGGYSDMFDKTVDKGRMDLVDKDKLLSYAGGDTDATYRVKQAQKKELLRQPRLASFYVNILHPSARAFEKIEINGVYIDRGRWEALQQEVGDKILDLAGKAKKIIGGRLVAKHGDSTRPEGINIQKASLLNDFMFSPMGLDLKPLQFTEKTGAPSSAMEHLQMFADHPEASEFIKLLEEYGSATKTMSTYLVGFSKHIRSDGRFHPSYYFFAGNRDTGEGGTVTGRLSVRDPAFQCAISSTSVYTEQGNRSILSLVEGYESGERVSVLTHTGEVKPIIGVYRNGVKPVFKITLKDGKNITCTGNHPLLTTLGFKKTDNLTKGLEVFTHDEADIFSDDQGCSGRSSSNPIHGEKGREVPSNRTVRLWCYEDSLFSKFTGQETEQVLWLLQVGETYNTWTHAQKERVFDLLGLATHDLPLLQLKRQGVQELWRAGDYCLSELERLIRELSTRYGGEASELEPRPSGRKQVVLERKLPMGNGKATGTKQEEQYLSYLEWANETLAGVGGGHGDTLGSVLQALQEGVEYDSTVYHALQAREAGFLVSSIQSIEYAGEEETYDLTIQDSHSYIGNGIVVHNTIPKHTYWGKKLRSCYTAPEGHLVGEFDYSQGELRVVACVANEYNMIEAYQNGKDLHTLTASNLLSMSYEDMYELKKKDKNQFDTYRQYGKPCNFGLLYGMSAQGLVDYARANYGVHFTLAEAQEFRELFLYKAYPMLPVYHDNYKRMAREYGYVESPLGRLRHLPLIRSRFNDIRAGAERQAVNSPIQGCLSDMLCWSTAICAERGLSKISPDFGAIHDATYKYIPIDRVDEVVGTQLEIMENLPFHKVGWNPQLKFIADAKVGESMGQLDEWEEGKVWA